MKKLIATYLFSVPFFVNAQNYDTIQVGLTTAVHRVFESRIITVTDGLGEQIDPATGRSYRDILIQIDSVNALRLSLTAAVENFETTNLFVETESGYFNFILKYSRWPKNQILPVPNEKASVMKKARVTVADLKQAEMSRLEKAKTDTIRELAAIALKKKFIEPEIGEKKQKMVVYLNNFYVDEKNLYFRVTMKNEGNIKFDVGNEIFQVVDSDGKGLGKKSAVEAPENKRALFVLNDELKEISSNQEITKVYVFEKFTISSRKKFVIDVWEKKPGQRIFQLKIDSDQLLKAERL